MIYAAMRRGEAAERDLEAAASVLSGKAEYHKLLAEVYTQRGRPDQAARQLNLATDSQRSEQQAPAGCGGLR